MPTELTLRVTVEPGSEYSIPSLVNHIADDADVADVERVDGDPWERNDRPPLVAWFVVETDVEGDRDGPIHTFISGPFPSEERAEQEADAKREAWEDALEEWDGENPYDHKRFDVQRHLLRDFQLAKLEREDRESFEIRRRAAGAVGASLLAEDGIGPLADDSGGGDQ